MATQVQVPALGESVTQAILIKWHKSDGQTVSPDEPLCELETDKANVDIPAPTAGVVRHVKEEGETVGVGEVIARIDDNGAPRGPAAPSPAMQNRPAPAPVPAPPVAAQAPVTAMPRRIPPQAAPPAPSAQATSPSQEMGPAVRRLVEEHRLDISRIEGSGPGGRVTKEDVLRHIEQLPSQAPVAAPEPAPQPAPATAPAPQAAPVSAPHEQPAAVTTSSKPQPADDTLHFDPSGIHRTPMSKIRKRIAENLLRAQQTAAILTTFNEIDMNAVMELRSRYKERFQEIHGVGLGFMSFFARACALALKEFPRVNASIEGDDIVYHNYVHLGIAVSTDRGLAVPVMRNAEQLSFARVEQEVKRLATATRDGKLSLEELSGGTFTVTNGGIFGSMLSTPILNRPQSAILGLHAIQKRAVVVNDEIGIRPIMYVALSYDHRLVDGRESVSFLVRIKQLIEDPARLMLEV
jgi:2-oxoglutarate dehydrogenase E2 component (dihydrolipoamide succinyltransferase)